MVDEANVPPHRWYQRQNHIRLPREDVSRAVIKAAGIAKIDAWISLLGGVSAYAVANFEPALVFDFVNEYYRTGGSTTTFDAAMTHSRAGNATMVDSDGLLKWAPHNLLTYSNDFTNASWNSSNITYAQDAIGPDGVAGSAWTATISSTAKRLRTTGNTVTAETAYTFSFYAKKGTATGVPYAVYDVSNAAFIVGNTSYEGDISTDGWARISVPFTTPVGCTSVYVYLASTSGSTGTIFFYGAHLYRSDLGGMMDNPDTGNSYVPTTSAARYLPRRGHHIYNGAEWVNEGVLVESEARTNLLLNSGTLATQNVTVTAVPHTLHFTGTGTVVLSGTHIGTLVGTGTGENNRVSLTFTPTAGTLTVTVTGTVTNVDLEVGSTLSSHKPTSGSTVTRAADIITVPYANLPWPTLNIIGEELVTNGDFSAGSDGWTLGPSWSVVGEQLVRTGGIGSDNAIVEAVLTEGLFYIVTFTVTEFTAGTGRIVVGGNIAFSFSSVGTYTISGTTQSNTNFAISQGGSAAEFTIDNISVKEIDPLSVSIQMDGKMTYADTDSTYSTSASTLNPAGLVTFYRWADGNVDFFYSGIDGTTFRTGRPVHAQRSTTDGTFRSVLGAGAQYTPDISVPFSIAVRHGSTFINGANEGTALTASTTPTALPDLSATNLQLGSTYMGTIKKFRMWSDDLGDTGIAEASA